jgi:hypothetical protein
VKVFGIARESPSITSVVPKWRPFSFIFNWEVEKSWVGGDDNHFAGQKVPREKRKCEKVRCRDVAKVLGEVFAKF